MADSTPKSYHTDPQLYLYTSLTSGSSQIVTATSRLQTILNANRIQYQALDVATDEKARMLWGRRAGKRKLPGLVRMGMILGDLEQVEEWNEYGEIKENLGAPGPSVSTSTPTPSTANTPSKLSSAPVLASTPTKMAPQASSSPLKSFTDKPAPEPPRADPISGLTNAMRQAGFEAAKKAGDAKTKARTDFLESAKVKDSELSKLDNSGPTGMPPPTGSTEASEAVRGESGQTTAESKADDAPATSTDDERALEAEDKAGEEIDVETFIEEQKASISKGEKPTKPGDIVATHGEEEVLEGRGEAEPEIPEALELEGSTNRAIAKDHEALDAKLEPDIKLPVSEGLGPSAKIAIKSEDKAADSEGQAVSNIATATELEKKANEAIAEDESRDPQPGSGRVIAVSDEHARKEKEQVTEHVGEAQTLPETLATDSHEAETEGDEKVAENGQDRGNRGTSATDEEETLQNTKTQDQPAASGNHVGESVGD